MIKHLLIFLLFSTATFAQTSLTDAREIDANGYPVLDGQTITVEGLVLNPNLRPGGLTFAIYDTDANIGLSVFSNDDDLGYNVTPGDIVTVTGILTQFRGLCQVAELSSVSVLSTGNPLPAPTPITSLSEATESALVVFEDAYFTDESEWSASGSGFNCTMTNGTQTILMRIDSDVDIFNMAIPTGTFDIIGVGGQFDQTDPLFDDYQLLPRSSADIQPYIFDGIEYMPLTIPEAKETDSDGVTTRENDPVQVSGVIHGLNFRPSGLQFTIIDENANGIGVFSFDEQFGLDFAEGKAISVEGRIDQFAGLIQVIPDAITVLSENQTLTQAANVTLPSESTESAHIEVDFVGMADPNEWLGDGTSFNVNFLNQAGDTILVRIDNDSPLSSDAGDYDDLGYIRGIGGQFDTSSPFDGGYQVLALAVTVITSTEDLLNKYEIEVFPNPTVDRVQIRANDTLGNLVLMNVEGKKLAEFTDQNNVSLSSFATGQYYLQFTVDKELITVPVIKK